MATEGTLGGRGDLFIGEDKTLTLEVFSLASGTVRTDAADLAMSRYLSQGTVPSEFDTYWTPVDMSDWAVSFVVRTSDTASTALLTKSASVTGSYNATRASNTQRLTVTLTDDDLAATVFSEKPYRYSWKRTDAGAETVLRFGDFRPDRVTQV